MRASNRHPQPISGPVRCGARRAGPAVALTALLVIPSLLVPGEVGATFTHMHVAPASAPAAFIQQRRTLSYPFEQVWPTAIRYLVVDRGYQVSDRDEDAGYMLFAFPAGQAQGQGSLEMFRVEDASGRPGVELSVSTSAGPSHLPHTLLEGIAHKVRQERGQPAPPPPRKDPPPDEPPEGEDDPEAPDEPPDDGSPPMMPPPIQPNGPR